MIAILSLIVLGLFIFNVIGNNHSFNIEDETQFYPAEKKPKCFVVFGHTAEGKGITHEVYAENSAEALDLVRESYPDERFNHCNLK